MSPDLNSVPPSPRPALQQQLSSDSRRPSAPPSRRASQIYPMNPPPLPLASPGGTIPQSVQQGHIPFPPLSPGLSETTGVPMRHPRPLTAAELHLELEKEQEAIVNRLTRELTALRAHSSSVASTTSMSSNSTNPPLAHDPSDPTLTGPNHPAQSRSTTRHRSSSSVSASHRQPSLTTIDPGSASTPSAAARASIGGGASGGPLMPTTQRYEEVLVQRQELEEAKRENERLRRRVRELEAMVRGRRASSVSTRGEGAGSVSASASASERERSISVRRGRTEASAERGGSG